jgi:uncharacterized protein YdhG (YjbR/CyaY superfamily)
MARSQAKTIEEYIAGAPPEGRSHLRRLHALLKRVAPDAEEAIKWGTPFFIEPRFLFAFSAQKQHLSFAVTAATLNLFRPEIAAYRMTKELLQIRYDQPLPEELIRRMAECRVKCVSERKDDGFW